MYGHKFTSSYGEVPNNTWIQALSKISAQNIANGLAACLHREDSWPPTLPEFVDLCQPSGKMECYVGLPRPKANKQLAKEQLLEIKKKLAGK